MMEDVDAAEMPHATLGHSGPIVSKFALGTMTFGAETDEDTSHKQLDLFTSRGGTFIDTADVYSAGVSEEIIGRWLQKRGRHDDLILATKSRFAPPKGSHGGGRRAITTAVNASLKRLRIDAIDLYFIHGWDKDTEIEETLHTLGDLVSAGKIHHIAWSNVSAWQLQRILCMAEANGLPRPVAVQPQYNLLDRGIETEVLPCCLEEGVSLTPWSPLGGGWLTGKYTAKRRPTGATRLGEDPNRGVEAYDLRNTQRTYAVLDVVEEIAQTHNRPMSHVALAWLSARPGVSSILLGARTVAQLQDNIAAVDLVLSPDEMDRLLTVSSIGALPYPYNFLRDWCGLNIWTDLKT